MLKKIVKRDGREVDFDGQKITDAIHKALCAAGHKDYNTAVELSGKVIERLERDYIDHAPAVEEIQDIVERVLMECGHAMTAKEFILYRAERTRIREMNTRLMKIYEEITFKSAQDSDIKRENANIDGNTAMGTMLKYGSEGAKEFYGKFVLKPEHARAHREGDIHIHDLDFYTLTTTCCQIDIKKLFKGGFSTGHGHLREPNDIQSYAALACIAIQSNQNDQHGGQSIVNFDYGMSDGVTKTYQRLYQANLHKSYELLAGCKLDIKIIKSVRTRVYHETGLFPRMGGCGGYCSAEAVLLTSAGLDAETLQRAQEYAVGKADEEIDRSTYQAMEAFIHNLNTMHSRAGAQTPFSSINYGMDTSPEGRLVIKNILLATEAGLGHGETAIFPIQIFRIKKGVNYDPGDPNYDLLRLAFRVSAKRMYPNFSFQDAPYNAKYYIEGKPETEIAYMGCRTRVIANTYDPENEISNGRGNLSFTSINLPRIAIKSNHNIDFFFEELERKLELVEDQLLERFEVQARKKVENFPFLMGQGVWIGSEKLRKGEELRDVLKHGTLSVGYIGLAECLVALTGHHHGENAESRNLGLEIISFMRRYADNASKRHKMNFTLIATPAEGLSGHFVKLDKLKYGVIEGVTDRDYYTNGFHVPVYYNINAIDKIKIEAPYHEMSNAGHITYVELDGDVTQNVEAFESVIRAMYDAGIGYGSINHPIDRDSVCGFTGVIGDECPQCGRREDEPVQICEDGTYCVPVPVGVGVGAGVGRRSRKAARVLAGAAAGVGLGASAGMGVGLGAGLGAGLGVSDAAGVGTVIGAMAGAYDVVLSNGFQCGGEAGDYGESCCESCCEDGVEDSGEDGGSYTGGYIDEGYYLSGQRAFGAAGSGVEGDSDGDGDGYGAGAGQGGMDIVGEEIVPFERIRRVTGYLVGTLDKFNNAKRSEEHDRVKHGL